jgi:hypothetical protein
MATSPNFNWPEPDNTDLVKNGALAIRTAVNAIDTSLVDLKGGTTGQILSKASNTDLDYTWVTTDDANAIQNAIVDAKGDLIAATAADTPARLAVGANGTMLVADSAETTGMKWKSATDQFPWQTWTPTYSNFTIGNATVSARYQQIGKLVNVYYRAIFGTTTSFTAYPLISLPTQSRVNNEILRGTSDLVDTSTGSRFTGFVWLEASALQFQPMVNNASSTYTSSDYLTANTIPFTWTTSDIMICQFSYEAL